MGAEIPLETRWQAEELYIVDGLTYAQVAERTGVSETQLQRWGTESSWGDRRREYKQANADIRRKSVLLQQKLVNKALDSLDPQLVYAAVRMGAQNARVQEKSSAGQAVDIDRPKVFLEDLEWIAKTLNEIDPEGLKILARNFEPIIERFKAEHAKTA